MVSPDATPESVESGRSRTTRMVVLSILFAGIAIALGVGGSALLARLKDPPQRVAKIPLRTAVQAIPAERGPHREHLTGYGRARPLRRAAVPAEISATIRWVSPRLEAGQTVTEGEELVRLDARDARSAADEASARLAQAQAKRIRARSDEESLGAQIEVAERELETSRRELERIRELIGSATSESEVDAQRMSVAIREQAALGLRGRRASAVADGASADAEIAAAQSALEKAANDVARAVVRAPYSGTIVARTAQPGERVATGTALFSIVDLRHVEIPVSLPASRHGEVAVGATAVVRLREGGEVVWTGTVSRVSPNVDTDRRVFEAFLDVVAPEGASNAPIAPGAFVVATVEGRLTPGVIAVPREAFVAGAMFVAEPDGDAVGAHGSRPALVREVRPTVVRRLSDSVLVGAGLDAGELVVVTGVNEVADGARVLVLDTADVAADGTGSRAER